MMGILKGCAKVVGSVVLGATGIASTVLKGMCDTAGVELGSEIFGAAKDASFDAIRNIWDVAPPETKEYASEEEAEADAIKQEIHKLKVQAYRCKDMAQKASDNATREKFMNRYEELIDQANSMQRESGL